MKNFCLKREISCVLLLFCVLCTQTRAQSVSKKDQQNDDSLRLIHEVTVKHHMSTQSLSITTPTPSQQLSATTWQRLGVLDAAHALKLLNGIAVRDYGGMGGMKTVSVRNLGAAHTAICMDGIPVSNTQAGQIDLSRLPSAQIQNLRLNIAGHSNLYAPAVTDAASGCIDLQASSSNLSVELATDNSECTPTIGNFRMHYASWNTMGANIALETAPNPNQRIGFHAEHRHTDGNYAYHLTNGNETTLEHRKNGDVDATTLMLYHHAAWREKHNKGKWLIKTQGYYYTSERGLPGSIILYNESTRERLWDDNFSLQSHAVRISQKRWQLSVSLKYNYSSDRYRPRNLDYSSGEPRDAERQRYRQNEGYSSIALCTRSSGNWQAALVRDDRICTLNSNLVDAPQPVRYDSYTTLRSVYRSANRRLQVQGSLLYTTTHEWTRRETESSVRTPDRQCITPTLSASYQCSDAFPLWFRAHYKQAFRLPNFNDLYYHHLGNRTLRPEKADEWNVGVSSILGECRITADLYHHKVSDKIVAFPNTFAWKMVNYGKVYISGIELSAEHHHNFTDGWAIGTRVNASMQKAENQTTKAASKNSGAIPYMPNHSGSASILCETPWGDIGWSSHWSGKRYSSIVQSTTYLLPAYCEQSLSISTEINVYKHNNPIRLTGSIINLTNYQYEIMQFYPMPGRQYRMEVYYSF